MKRIIAIIFSTLLIFSMFGCSTNPKSHSTKFSAAVGKWQLDSRYIDTVSKPYKRTTVSMELSDSEMVVTKTKKGKTTEDTYSVEKGNKEFVVNKDGSSVTYSFNYDPGAEVLHLYYEEDGKTYHEVYKVYSEKQEGQEARVVYKIFA